MRVGTAPYDSEYFARFQRQASEPIGVALMQARREFVRRHWLGQLLDVGIGGGAFVELMNEGADGREGWPCLGYDVNPVGVRWLQDRGQWLDPYQHRVGAACCWDVLEHMPDFRQFTRRVQQWLFVSIPIFASAEHCAASKHFRPDEHVWYFTHSGFLATMAEQGWECRQSSRFESVLGREDIGSYALQRVA